jgi:hypothetical protein
MNGYTSKALRLRRLCGRLEVHDGGTQINLALAASLSDTRRLAFAFLAFVHAANQ